MPLASSVQSTLWRVPLRAMAQGFADDPQSQNGTSCPRNIFGTTSHEELRVREAVYVARRAFELIYRPLTGSFDSEHLRKIHWYLFQDIFPWAGEFRVVDITKPGGLAFTDYPFLASSVAALLAELKREEYLSGLTREQFVKRAAHYLAGLNTLHPFREGNGRAQREFIRLLAAHAGHPLSWDSLDRDENRLASVLSHTLKENSRLERILIRAMEDAAESESR